MRITFVLPDANFGGGTRVIAVHAAELQRRGHRVFVISQPGHKPLWRNRIVHLLKTGRWTPTHRAGGSHLDGTGLERKVLERYRPVRDADVPDADVVVATWWETAEWVAALSPAKGAKLYFVQHHEVFDYIPEQRARATYRAPLHKVVVAEWLRGAMAAEYGDRDVDLALNSVDHAQFFAPVRAKQTRPTLGFMYAPAAFKGMDLILQAIDALRPRFPGLRIVCFGSGSHPPPIEGLEFTRQPPQDRLREQYAQCDVWLAASRSEGFNLPAMEAMACRTPVVSTATGWPAEAVKTGHNGVLVPIDDLHALTEGAARVLSLEPAEWARWSQQAFDTVAESTWARSTDAFERALHRAIAKSRPEHADASLGRAA